MARPLRSHWKGNAIRDGAPHTTLVLRQMLTVSNYDYVTDYRFHLNGIFEATMSFTGTALLAMVAVCVRDTGVDYLCIV